MTKSIVKAKDYDVKIKYKGDNHYIGLGDIEINDKPLKQWLGEFESLSNRFNELEKLYGKELRALYSLIGDLTHLVKDNEKDIADLKKVFEKAIVSKMKVGF